MKRALYHQEFRDPKPMAVLKEYEDGTVDLGTEDGKLIVGSCTVSDHPNPGQATIVKKAEAAKSDADSDKATDKNASKADGKADATKTGAPNHK